jgi:hypothetical protein
MAITDRETGAAARRADNGHPREPSREVGRDTMIEARSRQRERFGGFNWGAALLGFLVAAGIAALLTGFLSAAGAATGLTKVSDSQAEQSAGTIGIVGGVLLLVVVLLAYYAGGYNAGRLSRFDGGRQGLGVWLVGLVVTVVLGAAGAILGSKYNVLEKLNLPRIPIDEGTLATGGAIALVAILLGTLLAAIVGGKAGERYHKKVDRAAYGG